MLMCCLFFSKVTIDASNNYGLASRKDAQMPTKSSSSGELGSLYWQIEVGAVVTSEFKGAVGLTHTIIKIMIVGKRKHGFHFLYHLLQNGKFSPRSPELGNGGGGGYCCVYLPDGSASLAPTRKGQLITDMLSSMCEKRGFPLKDIAIYLHGKDKVGACLLCTHHYRWTQVL